MAIIELELTRRDLITLGLSRKRSRGQPPGRPREIHTAESQPPNWGPKITRRALIVGGSVLFGTATLISRPWEWFNLSSRELYTTPDLERLGQQLRNWKLQDGRKMADQFSEVQLTADLLQGNLDPRTVLPQFKGPMTLSIDPQIEIGGLRLDEKLDRNDPRKVGIYGRGQLLYSDNWLKATSVQLQLNPAIQSSEAKFYIAVKEVTQLLYRMQYQKLYRELLESGTTEFVINNPTNIPISEEEKTSIFGTTISRFERNRYGYSSLDDFIDVGTRLQTAPIGATQRLDLEKRGQSVTPLYWSQVEQADTDFLMDRRLIQEEDGVVTWTQPFVVNEDFFRLFAEYIKSINSRRVLIAPLD